MEAEPQQPDPPRIYAACLASYVSGLLHGRWLDAAREPEELHEDVQAMLADSPTPGAEEFAVHDYMGFEGLRIGEYDSLTRISALARLVLTHGEAVAHWLEWTGTDELEEAEQDFEDSYFGQFADDDELEDHLQAETGIDDMIEEARRHVPESLHPYVKFDAPQYVFDLQANGELYTAPARSGGFYAYWSR